MCKNGEGCRDVSAIKKCVQIRKLQGHTHISPNVRMKPFIIPQICWQVDTNSYLEPPRRTRRVHLQAPRQRQKVHRSNVDMYRTILARRTQTTTTSNLVEKYCHPYLSTTCDSALVYPPYTIVCCYSSLWTCWKQVSLSLVPAMLTLSSCCWLHLCRRGEKKYSYIDASANTRAHILRFFPNIKVFIQLFTYRALCVLTCLAFWRTL